MARAIWIGGGGGADLDAVTADAGDVLAPKVIVGRDGEPVAGTLALSGNAQAGHVLAGETFYAADAKLKMTGAMTVNSLLSFSAQPYSGRQVLLKWQNPYAAAGKPFSGVVVKYAAGAYPPWYGGTVIYAGIGGSGAPGGWGQAVVTMPSLNTAYYFTALTYATTSMGDLYGPNYDPAAVWQASAPTQADLWLTFTGTQIYTVPAGYAMMDAFAAGGGGGGGYGSGSGSEYVKGGGGGGGGYTSTVRGISISLGQVMAIMVGAGGNGAGGNPPASSGGSSNVTRDGIVLIDARGGFSVRKLNCWGGDGGSGGGSGTYSHGTVSHGGGSNGSDGTGGQGACAGIGQHTSTRAWGNGALYSGGGGGGSDYSNGLQPGGAGGGGTGGQGSGHRATPGAPNTGGGGGGDAWAGYGAAGGSGIVLLHLY